MEVKEAARRILWHYKLLILFLVTGGLMSLALRGDGGPMYVASSRLVAAIDVESGVAADSVTGIATSEARIEEVLAGVNIDRDPGSVASRVSITPIGSSGVVELAVSDPDPVAAVAIARGLSYQVIEVMRRSGLAHAPLPYLVNTADISTTVVSSGVQDVALGALVGLVLGILFTALLEAISPTIIGGDAIAAELRAPLLTVVRHWPRIDEQEMAWLSWQVGFGARRLHVRTVEITTVDPSIDVRPLAQSVSESAESYGSTRAPRIRALAADGLMPFSANGSVGLVIAAPTVLKDADLEPVRELMMVTGWPTLGVIAIERLGVHRWFLRVRPMRRRPSKGAAPSQQPRSLRPSRSGRAT
jgi:capsular polysaccharide biosynthesis protein